MEELKIEFVSEQSYYFSYIKNGKNVDFHYHIGKYQNDFLHIIISDSGLMLTKDVKFLNYINDAVSAFGMNICNIFGFYNKGIKREIRISVSCNSIRINFAPTLYYDDEYKEIMKNIPEKIFEKIKSIKIENLY